MSYNGLDGKVAIVTGAAQGIGAATVRRLADEGCRVVAVDVKAPDQREIAASPQIYNFTADVSTEDGCRGYVEAAVSQFQKVDLLVNNAGITGIQMPLTEVPLEDFDAVFATNAKSVFLGMRFFLLQVYQQDTPAAIVNVSSMAALKAFPTHALYTGSKHAVVGFSNIAAVENGSRGIRVNTILPGSIDTPMSRGNDARRGELGAAANFDSNPIPRRGTAAEVADLIAYLLSDDAGYLTGGSFTVDGGMALR